MLAHPSTEPSEESEVVESNDRSWWPLQLLRSRSSSTGLEYINLPCRLVTLTGMSWSSLIGTKLSATAGPVFNKVFTSLSSQIISSCIWGRLLLSTIPLCSSLITFISCRRLYLLPPASPQLSMSIWKCSKSIFKKNYILTGVYIFQLSWIPKPRAPL